MSNYMTIKNFEVANGDGIGVSIFLSGCTLRCKGCFNKEAWDFNAGQPFTDETLEYLMDLCGNEHINHLSILGGDGFAPDNIKTTYKICKTFKERYPNKKLWLWTGYDLQIDSFIDGYNGKFGGDISLWGKTFYLCDIVIDQPFIEELKDLKNLKWCGSSNQRVIDVQQTLEQGEVVLYEG